MRWRPRFSLRTLVVFMLLVTSGVGLWWRSDPWRLGPKLKGQPGLVSPAADISHDGLLAATGAESGTVRIWSAETGECLQVLGGHKGPVMSTRFSRDGLRVISAGFDGTARAWDVSSGERIASLEGHEGEVDRAYLSWDGALAATCTGYTKPYAARVHTWDVATGRRLASISGAHPAFSPDGTRMKLEVYCDKTDARKRVVAIFDPLTGKRLETLKPGWDMNWRSVYSPYGKSIHATLGWPYGGQKDWACAEIWYLHRPVEWWGVFYLWEFWLTVVFAGLLVWSVMKERWRADNGSVATGTEDAGEGAEGVGGE